MSYSPAELRKKGQDFELAWGEFDKNPTFEGLVEFAVASSSMTELLAAKGLSGLHQIAHALEQRVLSLFDDWGKQTISPASQSQLGELVSDFCLRLAGFVDGNSANRLERRAQQESELVAEIRLQKSVLFVTHTPEQWQALASQLGYFGIQAATCSLDAWADADQDVAILLVDAQGLDSGAFVAAVQLLRGRFVASQIIGLNLPTDFDALNHALGAGCNFCFVQTTAEPLIMGLIVKLCHNEDEPVYRVLVVEDSKTASAIIQRTLSEGGIECLAISRPQEVLTSLHTFDPDLILMDMYMPGCTGVEVTRVIRQHAQFLSTPVVYLSADTNVALQVDALRLGGDHFLTKPFNPVILNAVVKSKIERYRALRKTMFFDSLTGLLNHTSSKQRVATAIAAATVDNTALCVVMLDIDHFKKVNDSFGHPMGDQVIRSMAWLLKQRLRKTDVVGRYGGEEFLVILPSTNLEQAYQLLDAIRLDFSMIRHLAQDVSFACTFSAGIAQWSAGMTAEELVKQADEVLYQAKHGGRNQVAVRTP